MMAATPPHITLDMTHPLNHKDITNVGVFKSIFYLTICRRVELGLVSGRIPCSSFNNNKCLNLLSINNLTSLD